MDTCTEEFARLAQDLDGVRCDANPLLTLSNPFDLENWTLPAIEFALVAALIACLVHAVRWYRRERDASNLVVWCSGVLALLMIEPIAYFPQWFGIEDELGLTFVHNQFTAQFLYDRLPLYIVAMYPVFAYLAYTLVQRTGIFARYPIWVSAASVAFIFHCLFEVIDPLGPQLKWWVWNTELSTSEPSLGVVPYLNITAFTLVVPFGITLVSRWLCTIPHRGRWFIVRDVAVASVLVWPMQFAASVPPTIVDLAGGSLELARAICMWLYIAGVTVIAITAFVGSHHTRTAMAAPDSDTPHRDRFPLICTSAYLALAAAMWIYALPDHFRAVDGIASNGGQLGSFTYAAIAFAASIVILAATHRPLSTKSPVPRETENHPASSSHLESPSAHSQAPATRSAI